MESKPEYTYAWDKRGKARRTYIWQAYYPYDTRSEPVMHSQIRKDFKATYGYAPDEILGGEHNVYAGPIKGKEHE